MKSLSEEQKSEVNLLMEYITISELIAMWRDMTPEEIARAEQLIPLVCASLRMEAKKVDKDLDAMVEADEDLKLVAKSVTGDVVARALLQSTQQEPLTQFSQTAGSYTVSGTYMNAGGGLFIKKSELARLGIKRQRFGGMDVYTGD